MIQLYETCTVSSALELKDKEIAGLRRANESMSAACVKSDEHIDKIEAKNRDGRTADGSLRYAYEYTRLEEVIDYENGG